MEAYPSLDAQFAARARDRRRLGLTRAAVALDALADLGCDARLGGSFTRDRVLAHSDLDFVVLNAPVGVDWFRLLSTVEAAVPDLPVDVVLLTELPPDRRARVTEALLDASAVRDLVSSMGQP